jgi:arylsulfatase A-like enzyme
MTSAPVTLTPREKTGEVVTIDAIEHFEECSMGHGGPLVDLGDPTARAAIGPRIEHADIDDVEREGATWARVRARSLPLTFTWNEPDTKDGVVVTARVRGGAAKSMAVYLNGHAVGKAILPKGESKVVSLKASLVPALPGTNELLLRFSGGGRGATDALAEIDWVHVGDAEDPNYAAPTRAEVLTSATRGGVPVRAISLRAPGYARCTGWLPARGAFRGSIALAGEGEADAEVRLLRDRSSPVSLGTVHLSGRAQGQPQAWQSIDASIDLPVANADGPGAGALGALELVVKDASKGARVLFGAPRVVARDEHREPVAERKTMPPARGVVLVVLGTLTPRALALYGGAHAMPELSGLARTGVTFDQHRATTTLSAGAMASMLTGLPSYEHRVTEADARLPRGTTTIATAARAAGIPAAMWTANPTTGPAFGFDDGWETFKVASPTEEGAAMRIFDDAAAWIDAHAKKGERFLAVVHARGGHPPWEVSPEALKDLPPAGYTGVVDPRHAGELLAKARRIPSSIRFSDADRERAWALYGEAIDAHDAALGRLLAAIKNGGHDAETAIFVTADVGADEAAHAPFVDGESLDEPTLRVPLVVRPAAPAKEPTPFAAAHVAAKTEGTDLARSILDALGLEPPVPFRGVDLWSTNTGGGDARGRPTAAVLGPRALVRWGDFELLAAAERETRLCDLALEPACIVDVRSTYPLATEALHRFAFDTLVSARPRATRELATPFSQAQASGRRAPGSPAFDPATASALRSWGAPGR